MGVCVCFLDCVSAVVCMCVRKYLMKTELLYQSKRGKTTANWLELSFGHPCLEWKNLENISALCFSE